MQLPAAAGIHLTVDLYLSRLDAYLSFHAVRYKRFSFEKLSESNIFAF